MFVRFWKDNSGATVIEYGLIAAVLSLAVVSGVGTFGNAMQDKFNHFSDAVSDPTGN